MGTFLQHFKLGKRKIKKILICKILRESTLNLKTRPQTSSLSGLEKLAKYRIFESRTEENNLVRN